MLIFQLHARSKGAEQCLAVCQREDVKVVTRYIISAAEYLLTLEFPLLLVLSIANISPARSDSSRHLTFT